MAGITANELIDPSVLKTLEKLNKELKNTLGILGDLTKQQKATNEELKKGAKTNDELAKNKEKVNKSTKVLTEQERNLIKIQQQEQKVIEQVTGSYNQMNAQLNAARLRYKNMSDQERQSKFGKETLKNIQQLDTKLKAFDKTLGQSQRYVGQYEKALGGLTGGVKSLLVAFGATAGLYAFANVIKSGFKQIKDFDKAMSGLKAVANATDEQMKRLKNSALELGATTPRTASEVAELQTEFAKLGFTADEILNVTQATINLSIATGTDLANAATIAGSTLRGFNLNASETQRVVDVMAMGFNTTSLDISNFSEAMKYVAPVAASVGFTIEETTAMLGKLADSGIKGSMAGTGLRRIFSEIAKTGKPTKQAFDELAKSGLTLAEANDEVGQFAQTALLILSKNKDEVAKLTDVYKDAKGAVQQMADTMADNLAGDVDKATSAWEGFILGIDSGNGVISRVSRSIVQAFTRIVDSLNLANKSAKDLQETAQDKSIQEMIERDRVEVDRLGQSYIDARNNAINMRQDEIKALNETRSLLLKNKDVTNEELNANSDAIKSKLTQIILEKELRDAAIAYLQQKKEAELKALQEINDEKNKAKLAADKLAKDALDKKKKDDEEWLKQARALKENELKILKQSQQDSLNEYEENIQRRINLVTEEFLNGKRSAEALADEMITIQVEELTAKLDYAKANGIETLDIETKLLEARKQLRQEDVENYKQTEDEKRQIAEEMRTLQVETMNQLFEFSQVLGDRDLQNLEDRKNKELESAGNNAKQKEEIEAKYQSKIAQIRRRQAIVDKIQGLFNIGINTAQAITKTAAQLGFPAAAPFVALTAALGVAQAATVIAKPIPKFAKGVRNLPESTIAEVGEIGRELIKTKEGEMFLTPDRATKMVLPKGASVLTNAETEKYIQTNGIDNAKMDVLISEQKKTRQMLTNKKQSNLNITQKGWEYSIERGNSRIKYIDRYFRN